MRGGGRDRLPLDEHGLGVTGGVGAAAVGGSGLEQHGRALRRRGHSEDALRPLIGAVDLDAVQHARVGIHTAGAVADLGILVPGVLPEPQARVEELVGRVIPLVVAELLRHAEQLVGRGLRRPGDDVPADAAGGEPVERREPAGGAVGLFDRGWRGDDKSELAGRVREGRDREHRVKGGELNAVSGDLVRHPSVERGVAVGVGEEEEVEARGIQHRREPQPVGQVVPVVAAPAGVGPGRHPVVGVHHFERAEQYALRGICAHSTITTVFVSR